ncbi:MAG: hypothetical protein QOK28_3365 [Actinomycetota bacterium]
MACNRLPSKPIIPTRTIAATRDRGFARPAADIASAPHTDDMSATQATRQRTDGPCSPLAYNGNTTRSLHFGMAAAVTRMPIAASVTANKR